MTRFIKLINTYAKLYRNDETGIAWIYDSSMGLRYSVHPNIDKTGSVRGMKKLGYWEKKDKIVRCGGYVYNISRIVCDNSEYERIVADACMCECCKERRMTGIKNIS
jgi:hypothetical protein